ncbi:hypothetical protein LguiA_015777 [Lonicera macranthoides]
MALTPFFGAQVDAWLTALQVDCKLSSEAVAQALPQSGDQTINHFEGKRINILMKIDDNNLHN